MGFTNKLTGMLKKKGGRKEVISFENLDSYVRGEIAEEEERIVSTCTAPVENILSGVEELSEFLERLKEMEGEEMFKRLDRIVRNSQKRFANSLKNVVARIQLESEDYDGLTQFHETVDDTLQQIQKLNRMHGRSLYLAFDKEMKVFSKTAREIAVHNTVLGKLLKSEGSVITAYKSIGDTFSEIESMKNEAADIGKERKEIQNEVKTLEAEVGTLENELTQLKSSKEYEHVINREKVHENLVETLKSVEGEIYNVLHPLDRDFRKFKRQVELGKFPFDVKLLEQYEHLTEQFLKEEDGYPQLKRIAEKMLEALEKNVIKEKGHKKEKVIDILRLILDDGLVKQQREYHKVERTLETEVVDNSVVTQIETVKRGVEEKNDRIADLKEKEKDLISKKEDIESSIKKIEEEIREKCSEIGIQVE
jgi:peptidoglycan hydrolase CwlO-like protein